MQDKGLSRDLTCMRVARELREGMYINLGIGLPSRVANFAPEDMELFFHSENGILGYGRIVETEEEREPDLVNAGGQPVVLNPNAGPCFFDSAAAFTMIRGEHLDLVILGAYQVSEKGDLANWSATEKGFGSIGGAMDLAFGGAKRLIIIMEHVTKEGKPRIVKKCSLPLTAPGVVDTIFTNLAVIDVSPEGLILKEIAPGFSKEEVQEVTEPRLIMAPHLKEIEF
ncbi:3-oxoacid CoA-transferase subunit B [Chloroflexota bacterium]